VLQRPVGDFGLRKEIRFDMVVMDPISDMLTRIRNALLAKHKTVSFPASFEKKEICKMLVQEGYVKKFVVVSYEKNKTIKVLLKYCNGESAIKGLVRISKPGRRVYSNVKDLPRVLNGLGMALISTPKGILSDDYSRKNNVGGEILCYIW